MIILKTQTLIPIPLGISKSGGNIPNLGQVENVPILDLNQGC